MLEQIKAHPLIKPLVTTIGATTLSATMGCGGQSHPKPSRPPGVSKSEWSKATPPIRRQLVRLDEQNRRNLDNKELQEKLFQERAEMMAKEAELQEEVRLNDVMYKQALRRTFYTFALDFMEKAPGKYLLELDETNRTTSLGNYTIAFGQNLTSYIVQDYQGNLIEPSHRVLVSDDISEIVNAAVSLIEGNDVPEDFSGEIIPAIDRLSSVPFGFKKLRAGLIIDETKERFILRNERYDSADLYNADSGKFLAYVQYRGADSEGNDRYLFVTKEDMSGKRTGWNPVSEPYLYAATLKEAVAIAHKLDSGDTKSELVLKPGVPVDAPGEVSTESISEDFEF